MNERQIDRLLTALDIIGASLVVMTMIMLFGLLK